MQARKRTYEEMRAIIDNFEQLDSIGDSEVRQNSLKGVTFKSEIWYMGFDPLEKVVLDAMHCIYR